MREARDIDEVVTPKLRGVSHRVAFFVVLVAGAVLVSMAPGAREVGAALIYVLSLAGMYGTSALYHRPTWSPRARRRMRRLDHAGIFLLIAGTYTPVCLVGMPTPGGLALLAVVWAGALLGVLHAFLFVHAFRRLNVVLYVVLGCAALPLMPSISAALGPSRAALLFVGGAVYISGAVVYARRWPNPRPAVFGYHEVFHVLVILASALHFGTVFDILLSARPA